jgi:RNA polymerase sigma-70 factor (ECF subfamily)
MSDGFETIVERGTIAQLRAQDHRAFGALIDRQYQPVRRYLARLIGDVEVAADLTQETFLRAYQALPRLTDGSNVVGWLFRIATNLARQHHRRRQLIGWSQLTGQESCQRLSRDPEDDVTRRDLIDNALAQLPLEQRSCLLLYAWTGYTCAEIGEIVGKSTAAVRMLLVRARRRFRAAYGDLGEGIDGEIGHPGGARPTGGDASSRPGARGGIAGHVPETHEMEEARRASPADCLAAQEAMSFYPRGDLSPATFAIVSRHLVTCPRCRDALAEVQATYRLLQRHLVLAPGDDAGAARAAILARRESATAAVLVSPAPAPPEPVRASVPAVRAPLPPGLLRGLPPE